MILETRFDCMFTSFFKTSCACTGKPESEIKTFALTFNDGTVKSVGANVNNAEAVSTAGSAAIPVNAALSERQSG